MICLEEIISIAHRGNKKTRPTLVPNLDKSINYTVPKDEKANDFISSVQKRAQKSIGPNHYKRPDADLFKTSSKLIHFPNYRSPKKSIFVETSTQKSFIPSSATYKTDQFYNRMYRTLGTINL